MAQNSQNNVLIVGGSSGIGLAVAKLSRTHLPNAHIIVSSSNKDRLEKAVKEIQSVHAAENLTVDYIVADLASFDTQFDDVEALLKAAVGKFGGKIDHIIWTAGNLPPSSNSQERTNRDIIDVATTRLFGPLTLSTLAKDYMTQSKRSSITASSGVRVHRPSPGRGRLSGAAGGIEFAAKGLAVDLAPIRANTVTLGAIQTPLLDQLTQGNDAMAKHLAGATLLKEIGTAEEAAEAYLFSMRCAYVTGSRIDAEGGALLC